MGNQPQGYLGVAEAICIKTFVHTRTIHPLTMVVTSKVSNDRFWEEFVQVWTDNWFATIKRDLFYKHFRILK